MKKLIIIFYLFMFLCACEKVENQGNVYSYNNRLVFVDENNYKLSLYYDDDTLEKVEWVIITDSEEDAMKIENNYIDEVNTFIVNRDGKTVLLEYTETYMDEVFGTIPRDEMEKELKKKGYTLVNNE